MKPNNNRSIVHDTKHLHSMLIRPQELASAFPLFSPRATDPSLLISLLSHSLLAKRATIGKQLPQLQPPKESMEQHSQLPHTARASVPAMGVNSAGRVM